MTYFLLFVFYNKFKIFRSWKTNKFRGCRIARANNARVCLPNHIYWPQNSWNAKTNQNKIAQWIAHKNHKHVLLVAMWKFANLMCIVHEATNLNFEAHETFCWLHGVYRLPIWKLLLICGKQLNGHWQTPIANANCLATCWTLMLLVIGHH